MATLDTLFDRMDTHTLRDAIAAQIDDFEREGFEVSDVVADGPPVGLELEVFDLSELPEHLQEDGAILARAELIRIWADEVRDYDATRLARAA